MRRKIAILLTIAVVGGACSKKDLLGEGSTAQDAAKRPSAERCGIILKAPADGVKISGSTVLLADKSASSFTRPNSDHRQDWLGKLGAHVPTNGTDLVAMGLFGGTVDWKFQKVTPGRSNDAARTQNDLDDARDCLIGDMADAIKSPPTKPQTDVLRALAEGAVYVKDRPGAKSLYIATDGLSNTGCADLRGADIGDLSAIPAMVSACEPELPKLGKDFTVHFLGIGNAAEGWSDIKTPQRTWLVTLWKALCDATGANCSEPQSAKPDSVADDNAALLSDEDVTMPKIIKTPGNPTVLTVPASLLFDTDSYTLATGRSQDALDEVFKLLGALKYSRIEVAGHTDSTGTPEHNRTLSRQRADTVAGELLSRSFHNIEPKGYASTRPACPEFTNGQPDRAGMACNRRVEIIVYS